MGPFDDDAGMITATRLVSGSSRYVTPLIAGIRDSQDEPTSSSLMSKVMWPGDVERQSLMFTDVRIVSTMPASRFTPIGRPVYSIATSAWISSSRVMLMKSRCEMSPRTGWRCTSRATVRIGFLLPALRG